MKIYKSLDFEASKSRIEPNDAGVYSVHAEDFENINSLIERSIRTRTKFVPETDKNAVYDDFLSDEELLNNIDRTQEGDTEASQAATDGKQSVAEEAATEASTPAPALPI